MKSCFKLAAVALFASATIASADAEIRLTGSTAFRSAVHAALLNNVFTTLDRYAHSNPQGQLDNATKAVFKGSVANITGTTTIRVTWSGSGSGTASVANQSNVSYLTDANLVAAGENFNKSASANQTAHIALSDIYQGATSAQTPPLDDVTVAVIPFTWVVNNSANSENNKITSITAQQARALFTTGNQPLSLFTGNAADTRRVYVTGRNTGSGTRVTYLAETKYGYSIPVHQFQITATNGAVTELREWPTATLVPSNGGDALVGNGGYSGADLVAAALSNSSSSGVTIKNGAGVTADSNQSVIIATCIGLADAASIFTATVPGKVVAYDGVTFASIAADQDKIINGSYTMWGYEHLFTKSGLSTDEGTARQAIIDALPSNLGTAGIDPNVVTVSRGEDGGTVAP